MKSKLNFGKGIENVVDEFIGDNDNYWWNNSKSLRRHLKQSLPILGSLEEDNFTYIFVGPSPSVPRYELKIPKEFYWKVILDYEYKDSKQKLLSLNKLQAHIGENYSLLLEHSIPNSNLIGIKGGPSLTGVGILHHFAVNYFRGEEISYSAHSKELNEEYFKKLNLEFALESLNKYKSIVIDAMQSHKINANLEDYLLVSLESEDLFNRIMSSKIKPITREI